MCQFRASGTARGRAVAPLLAPVFLDLRREGELDGGGAGDLKLGGAFAAADDLALERGAGEGDGRRAFGAGGGDVLVGGGAHRWSFLSSGDAKTQRARRPRRARSERMNLGSNLRGRGR